ncbi:hypothetical protein [Pseudovibrio brasiliensis]|uniref:Uncharacterized protein n=1 Tax=Pseudovibrio brasiliensis TaxID=1898042 RepID=A0ABX8AWJ6_9HYPH|nr:hypothetical protein [Pseudovibrio brasiliensis]QUS59037.1 hypothetical protein KGB56_25825 [Pseudovibrio brasiliensis]
MSRLSKFEKLEVQPVQDVHWLADATPLQRRLYEEAQKQFDEKKAAIEAGQASEGKQRKIVAADVAYAAHCDKSYISKRKNPDLHNWIESRSAELNALAKARRHSAVSRRKTVEEVRKENEQLKRRRTSEKNYDYVAIAEAMLCSALRGDYQQVAEELNELKVESQSLRNQIAQLRMSNRQLLKSVNVAEKIDG